MGEARQGTTGLAVGGAGLGRAGKWHVASLVGGVGRSSTQSSSTLLVPSTTIAELGTSVLGVLGACLEEHSQSMWAQASMGGREQPSQADEPVPAAQDQEGGGGGTALQPSPNLSHSQRSSPSSNTSPTTLGRCMMLTRVKNVVKQHGGRLLGSTNSPTTVGYLQIKMCPGYYELGHRLVAWACHGPPTDASHEAIHLCGKKRCLNPDHLAWGTKLTNKTLSPNQLFKSSNLVKRARKPESVAVTTGTTTATKRAVKHLKAEVHATALRLKNQQRRCHD
ncbi:hypothetical protein V8C86DRAFT_2443607 [Haematococcus lacustris]